MSISHTPHVNDTNINTVHNLISTSYGLNTPLYYIRLDRRTDLNSTITSNDNTTDGFVRGGDEDRCKNGMCTV